MTYDEYISKEGVALPITGFEDLVFDYLEALNENGYDIPVDYILGAVFATQELVPHIVELNSEYCLDGSPIKGSEYVH